ncbi:MAG TPA: Fur family transcriptional regulator [Syntrophomonadaceae bacterium]|nr:Fur family transcriptional regulator [Syntrophomonadaceae bacterium]
MGYSDVNEKLKQHNYRLTNQREAVLEVMLGNRGRHLSAEEVLQEARSKHPLIGIATVYRTLDKLASMDILTKIMFGDKFRYEICDKNRHQHHHIICVSCGAITEVEEDLLNRLEANLEQKGFQIVDHDLKFYAYCPVCMKQKA